VNLQILAECYATPRSAFSQKKNPKKVAEKKNLKEKFQIFFIFFNQKIKQNKTENPVLTRVKSKK
jgi:hypothetical protein